MLKGKLMKKLILTVIVIGILIAIGMFVYYFRPAPPNLNTALIEQTFTAAPEQLKSKAIEAVQAIKNKEFEKAYQILQELQFDPELTPEQQAATMDLVLELEKKLGKTSHQQNISSNSSPSQSN